MTKKGLILTIAALVVLNVLQLWNHSRITNIAKTQHFSIEMLSSINSTLKQNLFFQYQSSGTFVGNLVLEDTLNNQVVIKEIAEKNYLFCSISEYYCESCVADAIEKMKNYVGIENADRIVFLLKGWEKSKTLRNVIDSYGIRDYRIYKYKEIDAKCDLERFPYYFMVSPNSCISKLYFPSKSTPIIDSVFIDRMLK